MISAAMKAALSELKGMAPGQQLRALQREYKKHGVDKYNYALLLDLAKGKSKGQPAPSSSHENQVTWQPDGRPWPDEELMDLVRDFFIDKEWMKPRAKYEQSQKNDPSDRPIITTMVNPETGEESVHNLMERAYYAPNVSKYRSVLSWGLGKTIQHRLKKLAVDRLLDRSRKILESDPYQFTGKGSARQFFHGEPSRTPSTATDDELNRAANQVRQDYKPKEREEANPLTGEPKREPELYDTPTLKLVLGKIAGELPNGFTLPDLRNIFKKVFQFAFSNDPVPIEEDSIEEVTEGNLTVATRVAKELLAVLTPDEEVLLARLVVGHDNPEAKIRQGDIDKELGVTPTTTKGRYRTLGAKYLSAIEGLSKPDRDLTVSILTIHLTEIELKGSGNA